MSTKRTSQKPKRRNKANKKTNRKITSQQKNKHGKPNCKVESDTNDNKTEQKLYVQQSTGFPLGNVSCNPLNERYSVPPKCKLCNTSNDNDLPSSKTMIKQSLSTAITDGYFETNIMKKIEKANNLNLKKVQIKRKKIGRGRCAFVHLARYKKHDIALKEYKFTETQFNDCTLSEFENELSILKLLNNHANIIKLFGFHLNIKNKILTFAFELSKHGSLFELIHPIIPIEYNYKHVLKMLYDIAKGMKYLHAMNIIHRDLKPKNLLLFDNYHVKIADFGESFVVDYDRYNFNEYVLFDEVGTDGYKAAEIIAVDPHQGYNYKIDQFAFASICYELFTQNYVSGIQYLTRFENLQYNLQQTIIPKDMPRELSRLITVCWKFNPAKRPNFDVIMDRLNKMII